MASEPNRESLPGGRRPEDALEGRLQASRRAASDAALLLDSLRQSTVVIYGAGSLGRRVSEQLADAGVTVTAFADMDERLFGSVVGGAPVMSLESAVDVAGTDCAAVVAVWNPHGHAFADTAARLQAAGSSRVYSFPAAAAALPGLLPHFCLDAPGLMWQARDEVRAAYALLADSLSRAVFEAHLDWRLGRPWPREFGPEAVQYFPHELYTHRSDEVVVDCGAFDGDTLRAFVDLWPSFRSYHAFEPDQANLEALKSAIRDLPREVATKVVVHAAATADFDGELRFQPSGDGGRVSADGDVSVRAVRLDRELAEVAPSLVKADVEGAERDTLLGARGIIKAHRPVLAVCVYHRPEDLWRLPLLCRQLLGKCCLYLRAHGHDGWETVLYAVPPDRSPELQRTG